MQSLLLPTRQGIHYYFKCAESKKLYKYLSVVSILLIQHKVILLFHQALGIKGFLYVQVWKVCVRIKELSHQLFSLEKHMKEPDHNNPRDSFLLWTRIPGLQSCSLHIQDSQWLLQDFCRSSHAREMFLYYRDGYKQLCLPFLSVTVFGEIHFQMSGTSWSVQAICLILCIFLSSDREMAFLPQSEVCQGPCSPHSSRWLWLQAYILASSLKAGVKQAVCSSLT